jgi:hypothetical protein
MVHTVAFPCGLPSIHRTLGTCRDHAMDFSSTSHHLFNAYQGTSHGYIPKLHGVEKTQVSYHHGHAIDMQMTPMVGTNLSNG